MFVFVLFVSLLTGNIKKILIFTFIILVHEIGHLLTGILLNWKVDKIYIYPFGGCTKFKDVLNKPMIEEFIILINGPLLQILIFIILKELFNTHNMVIFINYNIGILFFNLFPIFPLDGGKLFNILLNNIFPYKKSLLLSIYISFLLIIFLFLKSKSFVFSIILLFLLIKINDEYFKINMNYNKFLLERLLYKYNFKRIKVINNKEDFYKDQNHIIKYKNIYLNENEFLEKIFSVKKSK